MNSVYISQKLSFAWQSQTVMVSIDTVIRAGSVGMNQLPMIGRGGHSCATCFNSYDLVPVFPTSNDPNFDPATKVVPVKRELKLERKSEEYLEE